MEEKQSNGLAIASMVLGIVSLILTCILPYVSWVLAIVGIVLLLLLRKRQNQEWLQLVLYALSSH